MPVPWEELKLEQHAFSYGSCGTLYRAKWDGNTVAVKVMPKSKVTYEQFINEVAHMRYSSSNPLFMSLPSLKTPPQDTKPQKHHQGACGDRKQAP